MNVSINSLQHVQLPKVQTSSKVTPGQAQSSFANILKNTINDVNKLQNLSDMKTEALAQGKIDNLHDVMITAQKASVTLQATVEVQRKAIDAYNEIMRMQV
ncbi:flagellar hook-basal body complex protein FliE [Ornithinibacillus halotolerans]|uniref:Flagellar hook-basal body complex protein FliE n=1 Tax=Ornithinibacillus halotolerans TaxID=1274357 RepID=A0A916RP94_9BACI|nr:flagellar hook-basal body complex protein FliE [Ornithinibacillus halotolerans]GGA63137.1 flagellar hook-basal body complex protein FliE [Ornithinibacillus halotolerans]